MPDKDKKFHEFALKSILFKGRSDWYYCFLKAEKIAHALILVSQRSGQGSDFSFEELTRASAALPNTLCHFAAGEVGLEVLLADLFILISSVRLAMTKGLLNRENGQLFIEAYEELAERLVRASHPSPFVSAEDLSVPPLPLEEVTPLLASHKIAPTAKGHTPAKPKESQGHSERTRVILDYIKRHKSASIKDLSTIITDCSEKTIQRELTLLISEGLVRKEGERRWSQYFLA